ncbi:MAG: hypothetical protein Q7T87_04035 [Polaromonas sp.]|nr:hypothetical protein [Polaromonas sp.]
MALLGQAAVAMWWNMAAAQREAFEHWHSHEHFPERMGIPGFLRGSRWSARGGGEGFFVLYELDRYETLTSDGYMARLNHPTPWSVQMMPHHRDMVRSQCRVLHSAGGGIGRCALTVRLSPVAGREAALLACLGQVAAGFITRAGGVAFHVLRTETPLAAPTREQEIRGGQDAAADWIVVAVAYGHEALAVLQASELGEKELMKNGARAGVTAGCYELAYAAAAADLA